MACLGVFTFFLQHTPVLDFPQHSCRALEQSIAALQDLPLGSDQQRTKVSPERFLQGNIFPGADGIDGSNSSFGEASPPPGFLSPPLSSFLIYSQTTSSHL
jgi:hypothetical protein